MVWMHLCCQLANEYETCFTLCARAYHASRFILVRFSLIFTARCDASAVFAVMQCLSVCPSVRLSRSWITSKWIKISSKFLHRRVATPFLFFHAKGGADIPTGTPLTGASNARGMINRRFFSQISRCISETVIVRWAHAARQFVSIEFSFHPYNI